jgi:hypothetical protein
MRSVTRGKFRHLRPYLHERLRLRTEVPIGPVGDQRAWDGVIDGLTGGETSWHVEAETRLYDLQAQVRRIHLKQADAGVAHVLLIVQDSPRNRAVISASADWLGDQFPLSRQEVLSALRDGRHPGASAILLL